MVLADGGLCCIDEFDGIRTEDMSALNEPMEQQTLSIAKAGITTKLHTRTTIFAVTNPKVLGSTVRCHVSTAISGLVRPTAFHRRQHRAARSAAEPL